MKKMARVVLALIILSFLIIFAGIILGPVEVRGAEEEWGNKYLKLFSQTLKNKLNEVGGIQEAHLIVALGGFKDSVDTFVIVCLETEADDLILIWVGPIESIRS